ncbi:hypothetical protein H4R33_007065, partial [Dimargaris cristalligena]
MDQGEGSDHQNWLKYQERMNSGDGISWGNKGRAAGQQLGDNPRSQYQLNSNFDDESSWDERDNEYDSDANFDPTLEGDDKLDSPDWQAYLRRKNTEAGRSWDNEDLEKNEGLDDKPWSRSQFDADDYEDDYDPALEGSDELVDFGFTDYASQDYNDSWDDEDYDSALTNEQDGQFLDDPKYQTMIKN